MRPNFVCMRFYIFFASIWIFFCNAYQPIIVSLGLDCEVAIQLRSHNLRKNAYPFDWIKTNDFQAVCQLIINGFQDFLAKEFLQIKTENRVTHLKYNIEFFHDFPTIANMQLYPEDENAGSIVLNFLDYVDQIQHKFNNRIKRLYEILQGPEPILFFRTHIDKKQAADFIKIMDENFPKLTYQLVVVHNNENLNYEWGIAKVANFYVTQKGPLYDWFATAEWENIFKKLGLIAQPTV